MSKEEGGAGSSFESQPGNQAEVSRDIRRQGQELWATLKSLGYDENFVWRFTRALDPAVNYPMEFRGLLEKGGMPGADYEGIMEGAKTAYDLVSSANDAASAEHKADEQKE